MHIPSTDWILSINQFEPLLVQQKEEEYLLNHLNTTGLDAIAQKWFQHLSIEGVVAKLRDTARGVVGDTDITTIERVWNALKKYFARKKNYSHCCCELQVL